MAMTKAEMEGHHSAYGSLLQLANAANLDGQLQLAIKHAVQSFQHIDGMMQYVRKYQDTQSVSVETIDLIIELAPSLLDTDALDTLENLLKSQKRIERNTSSNLAEMLSDARILLQRVYRLFDYLEREPQIDSNELRRLVGMDDSQWSKVTETWTRMGFVLQVTEPSSAISLVTRMDKKIRAKCPSCGVVASAPKSKLITEVNCPKCKTTVRFVLLALEPSTS